MKQFNENWDGVSRKNIISEAVTPPDLILKAAVSTALVAAKAAKDAADDAHTTAIDVLRAANKAIALYHLGNMLKPDSVRSVFEAASAATIAATKAVDAATKAVDAATKAVDAATKAA